MQQRGDFHQVEYFHEVEFTGGQKCSPSSFSPVTSANVGISPQNFLIFSFNPLATLVENLKTIHSASPKLLNLKQEHPSKKLIFPIKSL